MIPTDFPVGSFDLVNYTVRTPASWEVMALVRNNVMVRDLTNDTVHQYDVSRLRPFIVGPGVKVKEVAADHMAEVEGSSILDHSESVKVKKRAEMDQYTVSSGVPIT